MERQQEYPLFNFPKLNAHNYSQWKIDMKVLLMDRNCWEFIEERSEEPEVEENTSTQDTSKVKTGSMTAADQKLKWRREKAYTTIYQGVERQFLPLISDTTDGRKAWEILKKNFEPKSRARLANLIDEFYELKFNEGEESIGIFCRRVQEKKQLILEAGFEMPEALVCFQLIRKLPQDFDTIVQQLYRLDDEKFTFTIIENQLINESGRINQRNKDRGGDIVDNAYVTKDPNFKRSTSNRSGTVLGQLKESRYPIRKFCLYCKKQGHEIPECYKRQDRERRRNPNFKRPDSQVPQRIHYSELSDENEQCYSTNAPENLEEWLIDSAATSHFCKERDWFDTFKELPTTEALIGDKDCKSKICGVLIVLVAVLATASCQVYRQPEAPQQYAPIPYSFNYLSEGDEGTSGHQETGDGAGNVQGSYSITDQDGRNRVVDYVADANGFRATVRTNEPGTDNSAPADVVFESSAPDAKGPVIRYTNEASYNRPQPQYYNTNRAPQQQPGGQNVRYVMVPSDDPRARQLQ